MFFTVIANGVLHLYICIVTNRTISIITNKERLPYMCVITNSAICIIMINVWSLMCVFATRARLSYMCVIASEAWQSHRKNERFISEFSAVLIG